LLVIEAEAEEEALAEEEAEVEAEEEALAEEEAEVEALAEEAEAEVEALAEEEAEVEVLLLLQIIDYFKVLQIVEAKEIIKIEVKAQNMTEK